MTQPINLQEILETATNMFIRKKKEISTSTFVDFTISLWWSTNVFKGKKYCFYETMIVDVWKYKSKGFNKCIAWKMLFVTRVENTDEAQQQNIIL